MSRGEQAGAPPDATNAPSAERCGGELSRVARPTESLRLNGSFGANSAHLDADFVQIDSGLSDACPS